MSHQVVINYQGISIQVQAQCQTAIHSLCQIDKVLDRIHRTANKLETAKVKEYETYLEKSKETIKAKIEILKAALEKYKGTKAGSLNRSPVYAQLVMNAQREAQELIRTANELTGSKLAVIDQMIDEGLLNAGQETIQAMSNKLHGVVTVSNDILNEINSIEDVSLRELTYQEILKDEKLSFDEALSKAQEEYNILLGKQTRKVIQEYKEELASNGIATEELDKVESIDAANAIVNEAITDETIRKETLRVIIKAIKERGFVVDTKKNLKFDKEKNIVRLVALKASGQRAEFEIQLNGKFMYRFDNYEGQACKKDIEPFLEDLKNIYDINILHEEVIWENPDKIQTKKYQYVNKNQGTN